MLVIAGIERTHLCEPAKNEGKTMRPLGIFQEESLMAEENVVDWTEDEQGALAQRYATGGVNDIILAARMAVSGERKSKRHIRIPLSVNQHV